MLNVFQLSNGKTYRALVLSAWDTPQGEIRKDAKGYYFYTPYEVGYRKGAEYVVPLDATWSHEEIERWMVSELVISKERVHRSENYPSWCLTLEDEISVYETFPDCPIRVARYVS